MSLSEEKAIVIVGAGICGLATALALHRKGVSSRVVERSESLRAAGAAIGIFANGWRVLDELGVGQELRSKAVLLQAVRDGSPRGETVSLMCLKRSDLINALANNLPPDTIRFGCQTVALNLDPQTSHPILHLHDGTVIKAEVVIGCDGINSVVADWLGLKTSSQFSLCAVRGLTNYPNGHGFSKEFVRIRRNNTTLGRIPIDEKLVHWFVGRLWTPQDSRLSKEHKLIRDSAVESIKDDFPADVEMIRNSDLASLTLLRLKYRAPWEILLGNFSKGTVTVAGDAMHVMGPFIGQGGSAGLEDAVVLARCFAKEMGGNGSSKPEEQGMMTIQAKRVGKAFDQYVKERRFRILRLSTQSYLTGLLVQASLPVMKLIILMLLLLLFPNSFGHTRHDCGRL
ncbi:monooxygenase 1-like isoform X2 [Macadamia integrifolia]|uniref:monooxygenase 1-like isoform X2 n=1 Tax=Macadamia integrifolia TaxID=60698 RepID=UPI001C4F557F|nr:monooxygenase 1-like isoform X2 [Macadamia integrifolia]